MFSMMIYFFLMRPATVTLFLSIAVSYLYTICIHRIIKWLGLEGTSKDHQVPTPLPQQGCHPLDQVLDQYCSILQIYTLICSSLCHSDLQKILPRLLIMDRKSLPNRLGSAAFELLQSRWIVKNALSS